MGLLAHFYVQNNMPFNIPTIIICIGFTLGLGKGVKVEDEGQISHLLHETMVPDSVSIRYT